MPDALLTSEEAARRLGKTKRYVQRLGREGKIERVKPPGSKYVWFKDAALDAYIEAGTQEMLSPPAPRLTSKRRRFS